MSSHTKRIVVARRSESGSLDGCWRHAKEITAFAMPCADYGTGWALRARRKIVIDTV
jgi:hypothetical protein